MIYSNAEDLPRFLSQQKIDIFVSSRIPQIFLESIPARLKCLWSEDSFDQPHVQCLKDPTLVERIDRIITVSRWQTETYRDHFGIPEERFFTSRNGFNQEFFAEEFCVHRPNRLVYTSTPFRGLDVLLDLFPEIRDQVPDAELYIYSSMEVYGVSPEEDRETYGHLYRKSEQPGVTLVGSVPQDRLARELHHARILAYPNHFAETSCIAAIEAQAAGTPVVTTALGGLNETVQHGQTGILIPGDSRSPEYGQHFVREIVQLLKDPQAWGQLSCNAKERIFQEYRWEVIAREWSEMFDRLLATSQERHAGIPDVGGRQSRVLACQKEIQANPGNPEPYNRLGLLLLEAGEPERALKAFRNAVARSVIFEEAYLNYKKTADQLGLSLVREDLDIVFYTVGDFTSDSLKAGGLGGSETAMIAMAQELSRLGRRVMVFNATQSSSVHQGVEYGNMIDFYLLNRFNPIPIFISSRVPLPFRAGINAEVKVLWAHDDCHAVYIHKENLSVLPIDWIFTVSQWHAQTWAEHFNIPRDHFYATKNGIDPTAFPEKEVARNPKKLIYTSRPDRGLSILLDLFPRIREQEPEAELHVFTYTQSESLDLDPEMAPCLPKLEQPGVFLRGSVPKQELYGELATSRLMVYPSIWRETSCIAVMEAQASGLPVITTDLAALPESLRGGILIPGNPYSQEYQDRFLHEVLRLMGDDQAWDKLSRKGREFVKKQHTWPGIAEEWNQVLNKSRPRPLLSLCMIVKDEEDMLADCLESVRTIVDEVVVVDTGSTDSTVEIAQRLGARVIHHDWNDDFSEPRNLSLNYARGEWILVLDADEVIAERDLPRIRALLEDPDLRACFLTQRTYSDNTSLLNWKKNQTDYKEGESYSGYVDCELIRLFRNDRCVGSGEKCMNW